VGDASPGAQAPGAGNPVESNEVRPKAQPEPATRPAWPVERVSRAWSDARSALRKVRGARSFLGHKGRPAPEQAAGRPGRGKIALSLSVFGLFSPPVRPPSNRGMNRRNVAIQVMTTQGEWP
jgi:hypothetical protein